MEFSDDVNVVFVFVKDMFEGRATTAEFEESFAWSRVRVEDAFEVVVKFGVVFVDD